MAKKAFDKIMTGMQDALAFAKGEADESEYEVHVPANVDVKSIRRKAGLTQVEFAAQYGFNPARLRDWEQGRSHPDSALRAYLIVIDHRPEALREALTAQFSESESGGHERILHRGTRHRTHKRVRHTVLEAQRR